jgi:hypothetical protein
MSFVGKCMELEIIVLNEISQTQIFIACFLFYVESRGKKTLKSRKEQPRREKGPGRGGRRLK